MTTREQYRGVELATLLSDFHGLMYELKYELGTEDMASEIEAFDALEEVDTETLADNLVTHIDTFANLRAICEEMLRVISPSDDL